MGLEEITYRGSAGKKEARRNRRPRNVLETISIIPPVPLFSHLFLLIIPLPFN